MTTTKLRATPAMIAEQTKRELEGILSDLRQRAEGDLQRYGRPTQKFQQAERAIFDKRFTQARDHLIDLQVQMDARDEAAAAEALSKEQERLADARNTPTARTETGVSTRDGWLWLVNKGRYSTARVEAGRQFKELYARATDDPMPSCVNDGSGGGGEGDHMERRISAQTKVNAIRQRIIEGVGIVSGANLYELLCLVVGQGVTVRQLAGGKDRESEVKVTELGFALDLAGVYLGAVRT
jgi:hypothetical protein